MKVKIDTDELWPDYVFDPYGLEVDVPDEILVRYDKARTEFFAARQEIERLYRAANEA